MSYQSLKSTKSCLPNEFIVETVRDKEKNPEWFFIGNRISYKKVLDHDFQSVVVYPRQSSEAARKTYVRRYFHPAFRTKLSEMQKFCWILFFRKFYNLQKWSYDFLLYFPPLRLYMRCQCADPSTGMTINGATQFERSICDLQRKLFLANIKLGLSFI